MACSIHLLTVCLLVFGSLEGATALYETEECLNIPDGSTLGFVLSKCEGKQTIGGAEDGYIDLSHSKESDIHRLFKSLKRLKMGFKLYRDEKLQVIHLAKIEVIEGKGAMGSIWIENSNLQNIVHDNASNFIVENGAFIRGNKILKEDALNLIAKAIPKKKPVWIQDPGECNLDVMGYDFANCTTVNNLVLPDGFTIPDDFQPKKIAGCLYIKAVKTNHNFLKDVDLASATNLRCSLGAKQVIEDNPLICLKDMEPLLNSLGRRFEVSNNGNPECRFDCNRMDYMKRQRWCQTYDTTLIIDDDFLNDINITDVLMHLKLITGGLVIINIGDIDKNITTTEELIFPNLEFVGGSSYLDKIIFVDETMLKKLKFPKLASVRGGDAGVVITEDNPQLKLDFLDVAIMEIAANGRKVEVAPELILPRNRKTKEELKKLEMEEEGNEEEETNTGAIVGGTIGGVVGVLLIVAVVVVVVVVVKKKKSSSKTKKKDKKGKDGKDYSKVPQDQGEAEKGEKVVTPTKTNAVSKIDKTVPVSTAGDKLGARTAPLLPPRSPTAEESKLKSTEVSNQKTAEISKLRSTDNSKAKTPTTMSKSKSDGKDNKGKNGGKPEKSKDKTKTLKSKMTKPAKSVTKTKK